MKRILVHGSTFSGIGAPEIASSMLGWENAFHCEINPFCRKILDYYYPNAVSYANIKDTSFATWGGQIDILTGGFPCQPFSYAGKRKGAEDDRYLWDEMLRVIKEVRPTWFVGENVAGITTMVFPSEDVKVGEERTLFGEIDHMERREGYVIEAICEQLEKEGYSVQPMLIPACAVGAPHRRDRIFFLAHREDSGDKFPSPDSNSRDNECGKSRQDGRAQGEERLQERNEIQQSVKSVDVRSKVQGHGRSCCEQEQILGDSKAKVQWNDSDSCGFRLDKLLPRKGNEAVSMQRTASPLSADTIGMLQSNERWRFFPLVSPVYRGNDGIPFPVDNLTISFNQWREQSLRAYGNAIVVQVIYEIFRYIEMIENGNY